jgi:threonine dehydratase
MKIDLKDIEDAKKRLDTVIAKTPLQLSKRLSQKYDAKIYLKREDLQDVRSYKIRGAYNKMASLSKEEQKRGVVTASAGNHAQGVASSCALLQIRGVIFMPTITPVQKIDKVKHFGGEFVEVQLVGTTFDESSAAAQAYCKEKNAVYIPPFNDPLVIAGQGTVGKEIAEEIGGTLDVIIAPIGGGGLMSGLASYIKPTLPHVTLYGAEPSGAAGMYAARKAGHVVTLETIDTFVDGAAVKRVGDLTFEICNKYVEDILLIPEGKVCSVMIELYQNDGIIAEPAGALSVAALDVIANHIKGKTVVCILSGGNNDILRYPEVMERSLVYQGRKHYFILEFAQKPGQLRKFLDSAMGPNDDIVRFEYMKKTNKERGAALVGVELKDKKDFQPLLERMRSIELNFQVITNDDPLYSYIV